MAAAGTRCRAVASLLVALAASMPLFCDAAERLEDSAYVRPVEIVRRFLAGPNASRCDLPSLDASKITWEDFKKLNRTPSVEDGIVLKGLIGDDFLPAQKWSKEPFLKRFGKLEVNVNDGRYDRARQGEDMPVDSYLAKARNTSLNVLGKAYVYSIVNEVFYNEEEGIFSQPRPQILEDFDLRPNVQVAGAVASGTQWHAHGETWLALLEGRKAIWIANTEDAPEEIMKEQNDNTRHPCEWLADLEHKEPPPGMTFCVQQAGEVTYFGDRRTHLVCNLDDFVLAVGAQGRLDDELNQLDRALHRGQAKKAQELIQKNESTNWMWDKQAWLSHAAYRGFKETVRVLVEARADVTAEQPDGLQALHRAVGGHELSSGYSAVAEYIISQKADINAVDLNNYQTALHKAAFSGRIETVELLVAKGAKLAVEDHRGLRPFASAADGGHTSILNFLLGHEGQVHEKKAEESAPERSGLDGVHGNYKSYFGPALFHAASRGHLSVAELLIGRGADPAEADETGKHFHDYADNYGHRRVATYLRKAAETKLHKREEEEKQTQMCIELFNHYDKQKTGFLRFKQLRQLVKDTGAKLSRQTYDDLCRELQVDPAVGLDMDVLYFAYTDLEMGDLTEDYNKVFNSEPARMEL